MSRGFVKEDDQEEIPLVPPRANLPEGVTNYVTQSGMDALLVEKENLIKYAKKNKVSFLIGEYIKTKKNAFNYSTRNI